jgi:hypothetical protein
MARTYLTPRKSTGGRVPTGQLAPRHRLEDVEEEPEEIQPEAEIEEALEEVQPEPVEEEDPEEVEMEEEPVELPQLYEGTVLEGDANGDLVIPPAPVEEDDAPPAPVDPAPNAVGGDPDDSGDDSGDEDEDDNNADENPEEDENPRYHGAEYHKHTTEEENGQFCILLREVLQHLGYTMKPLYVTKQFSEPVMRDYYTSRVYIWAPLNDTDGWRYRSSHHSTAHFSSDDVAVNDAARRAL